MTDEQQPTRPGRRRRGRRGRGPKPQAEGQSPAGESAPPGPPGPAAAPPPGPSVGGTPAPSRPQRRDTRGQPRQERSGAQAGRTHRAPSPERGGSRAERPRRDARDGGAQPRGRESGDRSRDRGPRVFEEIVPQDPISIELGARFKAAQVAVRDARKALDKRKAEYNDEPDWMLQQLAEAEAAFAEVATAWTEHLETTGRKVVRR